MSKRSACSFIYFHWYIRVVACVCVCVSACSSIVRSTHKIHVCSCCPCARWLQKNSLHTHILSLWLFLFACRVCGERKSMRKLYTHICLRTQSFLKHTLYSRWFRSSSSSSSWLVHLLSFAYHTRRLFDVVYTFHFFFHLVLFKRESVLKCTLNTLLAHFRIKCGRDELYRPRTHIYSLSLSVSVGRSAVVYIKLLSRTIRKNVPCTFIFKNVKCVQCQSSFILFSLIYGFLNV